MPLVEAAKFHNSFEAGLAKSRLEADGIGAVLFDTEMTWEGMGLLIPIRLMVLDEDLADAQASLAGDGAA
jgi:Putative prokaryotic signal transducing protein